MSLEDGTVNLFDVRTAKSDSTSEHSAAFTIHAHDEAVTSVSYNQSVPNVCIFNILIRISTSYEL